MLVDTWVYARAAAAVLGMDRWNEDRWKQEFKESATPAPDETGKVPNSGTKPPNETNKKSPFWQ